jgi:hypothetical protein
MTVARLVSHSKQLIDRVVFMQEEMLSKTIPVFLFFVGVVLAVGVSVIFERFRK